MIRLPYVEVSKKHFSSHFHAVSCQNRPELSRSAKQITEMVFIHQYLRLDIHMKKNISAIFRLFQAKIVWIFWSFPAADGQIGGHMDIILAVLNRIFHGLSFDISHDHQKNEKYLGVTTPIYAPRGGG